MTYPPEDYKPSAYQIVNGLAEVLLGCFVWVFIILGLSAGVELLIRALGHQ